MRNPRKCRSRILVVSCVAITVACITAGCTEKTEEFAQGKALQAVSDVHDFGEIMEGEEVNARIAFRNVSEETVRILSTRVNCGCVIADTDALDSPLAPGETRDITVILNSKGMHGEFAKSVYVNYKAEEQDFLKVVLKGRVKSEIHVRPKHLAFGTVTYGYAYKLSVSVKSDVSDDFEITHLSMDANAVSFDDQVSHEVRPLEDGGYEITYSLTPEPGLKSRLATSKIHLKGLTTESVPVTMAWRVVGPVKASPSAIVGSAKQRFEDTVVMTSTRDDLPLPPFDVSIDMANASVELLEASESKRVYKVSVERTDADTRVDSGYLLLDFKDAKRKFNPEKVAVLVRWQS